MGLEMDVGMQHTLQSGRQLRELLRQGRLEPRDPLQQILALTAVSEDWLHNVPLKETRRFAKELLNIVRIEQKTLAAQIPEEDLPPEDWKATIAALADRIRPQFQREDSL